jgi:hypothetical protein
VLENVEALIRDGRVPGSTRRWESAGFYFWDRCVVATGQIADGRWFVERYHHPGTGPSRAQLYATEAEALKVAEAVMAAALPILDGESRRFVEVDVAGG